MLTQYLRFILYILYRPYHPSPSPRYSQPDAQYLHCGAKAQSAVTHSGPTVRGGLKADLFLVSLQVTPLDGARLHR